ncbi:MAG: RNA polymerase-binding protein DksA [Gammaproteobacteria bacterium]|nr:RNA polymerase-binding protein DksA [Gammaproteobacteria bacterium]
MSPTKKTATNAKKPAPKAAPKKKAPAAAAKKPVAKKPATTTATKKAPVKKAPEKKTTATAPKAAEKKAVTTPAPAAAAPVIKKVAATPTKPASMAAAKARARAESLLQGFGNFQPYQAKKGEDYMNTQQAEHFRHLLTAWKHALMEEVDRTMHYMQDEAANFPDPNDRASQESDFTMELRTRDRERKLIKKIEESIKMVDDGEYGFCESCGIEIGIRRLEARPTATLCIDCKELDEIREKQMGG